MNLESFTAEFETLARSGDASRILGEGEALLSRLALETDFVDECLTRILTDNDFMSRQRESVWPNEITLFRHPEKVFSLLMYIWETGLADIVHDHSAWGIVCTARGKLEEVKYRRLDDGTRGGHAELAQNRTVTLGPGETTSILPLDRGIHRMRNIHEGLTVTLNVYGRPEKRGFIRFFDLETNTYKEAYPPGTLKRVLAARALLEHSGKAEQVLRQALDMPLPKSILDETRKGLSSFQGK